MEHISSLNDLQQVNVNISEKTSSLKLDSEEKNNGVHSAMDCDIGKKETQEEKPLFRIHRPFLVFVVHISTKYINSIFSNVAVLRWQKIEYKTALPDVIHEIVPVYYNHYFNEWPQWTLLAMMLMYFIWYDWMGKPRGDKIKRFEAFCRYNEMRIIMNLIRSITTWITSLPDANGEDCILTEVSDIDNVFTDKSLSRCGDNIISGHTSNYVSLVYAFQFYILSLPIIKSRKVLHYSLVTLLWILMILGCFYIVIARLHYTIDVLLSIIIATAVWYAYLPDHWYNPNHKVNKLFIWWHYYKGRGFVAYRPQQINNDPSTNKLLL